MMPEEERETPSRETVKRDIEGVRYVCDFGTCDYEGYLIPVEYDRDDYVRVVCPQCFETEYLSVYL